MRMGAAVACAAAGFLATAAHAEEDCPARVLPGAWSTTLSTVATGEALIRNFGAIRQSTPVSAQGPATVDGGACDGSFVLGMPSLSFEMTRVGGPDSPTYRGSASTGAVTYDMEITVIGPDRMVGGFEAKANLSGAGNFSAQAAGMTFLHEGGDGSRPECLCRDRLEAWIAERIALSRAYQAAWSDPGLRIRPATWPVQSLFLDYWGPKAHRRMVDMVVAGYTPDQAAAVIWSNTDVNGDPVSNDFTVADAQATSGGSAATGATPAADEEYVSVTAGWVDDTCNLQLTEAHKTECFPDIALQATIAHESVHVAQCEARMPIGGLNGQADKEATAYAVETEFWETWIARNCDG